MRKLLAAALCAPAILLTSVAPAHANDGNRTTIETDYTGVINDLCAFPVMVDGHLDGFVVSNDGVVMFHFQEVDVFSANDKSLTSTPYTFTNHFRFDASGDIVSATQTGVIVKVPLDNGETFMVAGRADFLQLQTDFIISPTNGVTRNLDDFCAALSA